MPARPARVPARRSLRAALLFAIAAAWTGGGFAAEPSAWLRVEYRELLDLRRTTQSGEQVGPLLEAAAGSDEAARRRAVDLLAPIVERYGFVMSDALDASEPSSRPAPMVEIAWLWAEGSRRPAWVDLLRARRFVVESDGAGRLRVFVPADGESGDPAKVVRAAWDHSWSVVRHALASELARLVADGATPRLTVRVHAFRHDIAASRFEVTREPLELTIDDAAPRGDRPPLDLASIERFLSGGLLLEGARLRPDGRLELFGTPAETPPSLLGAPLSLADLAVAWRAVAHGGAGRPFMSLDRGPEVHRLDVHHGGRLADTRLGLVTMLCDVRFKTFSQGIDPWSGRDDRARLRDAVPGFATHVERFAAAPGSAKITSQQTRFWFYPDAIDLTLSPEGDVLVFRSARMSAASERAAGTQAPVPPWTRATVSAINEAYDRLAAVYPELAGLDQVVRLLALFTWLERLDRAGAPVPDLDALLAVELPPVVTPQSFPQQLAFNALPAPGARGAVDVIDRDDVTRALDRLVPPDGRPLAPRVRARRALAALDRRKPEHARAAEALERALAAEPAPSVARLDALSQEAERLAMHRLVLGTLDSRSKARLGARVRAGERLRVFSTATGGLDLSMDGALERARPARSLALTWGGPATGLPGGNAPRMVGRRVPTGASPPLAAPAPAPRVAREDWAREPDGLVHQPLPAHAFAGSVAPGAPPAIREAGGALLAAGTLSGKAGASPRWWLAVADPFGPRPSARLVARDGSGELSNLVRVEGGRRLAIAVRRDAGTVRLVPADRPLGPELASASAAVLAPGGSGTIAPAPPPAGLRTLELPLARGDEPELALATSASGEASRELRIPAPQLERLVLGPRVDLPPPGRPIPPLVPPAAGLGNASAVMVFDRAGYDRPPWVEERQRVPGELFAPRVARALSEWWRARGIDIPVVAGTSPASFARWVGAPGVSGKALLLLPDDAFGWPHASLRGEIESSWHAGPVVRSLDDAKDIPPLVVLASAEPPALLGARLASLVSSPRLRGRLLAVYVAGVQAPRADLPAILLARGGLAGLGINEPSATAAREAPAALTAWQKELAASSDEPVRVEKLGSLFAWIF